MQTRPKLCKWPKTGLSVFQTEEMPITIIRWYPKKAPKKYLFYAFSLFLLFIFSRKPICFKNWTQEAITLQKCDCFGKLKINSQKVKKFFDFKIAMTKVFQLWSGRARKVSRTLKSRMWLMPWTINWNNCKSFLVKNISIKIQSFSNILTNLKTFFNPNVTDHQFSIMLGQNLNWFLMLLYSQFFLS